MSDNSDSEDVSSSRQNLSYDSCKTPSRKKTHEAGIKSFGALFTQPLKEYLKQCSCQTEHMQKKKDALETEYAEHVRAEFGLKIEEIPEHLEKLQHKSDGFCGISPKLSEGADNQQPLPLLKLPDIPCLPECEPGLDIKNYATQLSLFFLQPAAGAIIEVPEPDSLLSKVNSELRLAMFGSICSFELFYESSPYNTDIQQLFQRVQNLHQAEAFFEDELTNLHNRAVVVDNERLAFPYTMEGLSQNAWKQQAEKLLEDTKDEDSEYFNLSAHSDQLQRTGEPEVPSGEPFASQRRRSEMGYALSAGIEQAIAKIQENADMKKNDKWEMWDDEWKERFAFLVCELHKREASRKKEALEDLKVGINGLSYKNTSIQFGFGRLSMQPLVSIPTMSGKAKRVTLRRSGLNVNIRMAKGKNNRDFSESSNDSEDSKMSCPKILIKGEEENIAAVPVSAIQQVVSPPGSPKGQGLGIPAFSPAEISSGIGSKSEEIPSWTPKSIHRGSKCFSEFEESQLLLDISVLKRSTGVLGMVDSARCLGPRRSSLRYKDKAAELQDKHVMRRSSSGHKEEEESKGSPLIRRRTTEMGNAVLKASQVFIDQIAKIRKSCVASLAKEKSFKEGRPQGSVQLAKMKKGNKATDNARTEKIDPYLELLKAVKRMQPYDVEWILNQYPGIRLDLRDPEGASLLHIAVKSGSLQIAEMLLKAGADINAQDIFGNTPAHYAKSFANYKILDLLLHYGAWEGIVNDAGNTIWEGAFFETKSDISNAGNL